MGLLLWSGFTHTHSRMLCKSIHTTVVLLMASRGRNSECSWKSKCRKLWNFSEKIVTPSKAWATLNILRLLTDYFFSSFILHLSSSTFQDEPRIKNTFSESAQNISQIKTNMLVSALISITSSFLHFQLHDVQLSTTGIRSDIIRCHSGWLALWMFSLSSILIPSLFLYHVYVSPWQQWESVYV